MTQELIASNSSKQYEVPEEGSHQGILVGVIDLGMVSTSFSEDEKHMVRLVWMTDENDSKDEPMLVFQRVNLSTHEKSSLAKIVKGVTGALPAVSYNILTLLGKRATLVLENSEKDGRTYSNVQSTTKPVGTALEIPATWTLPIRAKNGQKLFAFQPVPATNDANDTVVETEVGF